MLNSIRSVHGGHHEHLAGVIASYEAQFVHRSGSSAVH